MLLQDTEDNIYMTGQKLHYFPSKLNFDPEILKTEDVRIMGCGLKHYILVTKDNNLLTWGQVFSEKSEKWTEGFSFHYGDSLFEESQVVSLEARYGILGALCKD